MTTVTTAGILVVISISVLSIGLLFFQPGQFSEIPVGKLSWGLIIGTVTKAKSCFMESLNKVQVRVGNMGRKD